MNVFGLGGFNVGSIELDPVLQQLVAPVNVVQDIFSLVEDY